MLCFVLPTQLTKLSSQHSLKLRRSLDTTALTSPKLGLLSKTGLEAYLAVIEMKQGTKTPQHYHRYRVITFSLCIWLSCSFAPKPTQQRIKFPQVAAHRRFAEADEELVGIAREASYIQPLHDRQPIISRARLFEYSSKIVGLMSLLHPATAYAKCTDIESCREEGERKIEADLKLNPIMKLSDGVRYRVLQPSTLPSAPKVKEGSSIDLIYSISTASGQYMYSKGFGFEKVSFGGKQQSDLGLDSMRIVVGKQNVPVGIESALIGMGRGERRRVELPPGVGFETSNWQPAPITRRGITQIEQYKRKLVGFGSQPAFPAETVWDIEVLGIRN